jgi:hypothetical protein
MLDHDDGFSGVGEPVEEAEQVGDVGEVAEAHRALVGRRTNGMLLAIRGARG